MTNERIVKALRAAAQALDPTVGSTLSAGGEVVLSLVQNGSRPFNKDTIDILHGLQTDLGDGDFGRSNAITVRQQNGSGIINRIDEKKGFKRETVVVLSCPPGMEKAVFEAAKNALENDAPASNFTVTLLPKYRKAQTVTAALQGKPVKAASGGQIFIGLVQAPALGEWLEPSSDEDELQEQIDAIVAKAKKRLPDAEEWMVSDYDEFPNLGEYPGVAALAKVAGLLEDHDAEIVQAAFEESHDADDAAKMLKDGYAVYDSEEEYGQLLVDDLSQDNIKNIEWYIDMDMLARDLRHDVNIVYVNGAPFAFHG